MRQRRARDLDASPRLPSVPLRIPAPRLGAGMRHAALGERDGRVGDPLGAPRSGLVARTGPRVGPRERFARLANRTFRDRGLGGRRDGGEALRERRGLRGPSADEGERDEHEHREPRDRMRSSAWRGDEDSHRSHRSTRTARGQETCLRDLPGSDVPFTFGGVRPRGIVFDLDGTLVDSLLDIADAMNDVLRVAGHPVHPTEAYRRFVGWGAADLVRRAAPEGAEVSSLLAAFLERYHGQRLAHASQPYAGIPQLLAALVERRVPLAVLSNKPHDATVAVVAHFFADVPFVAVVGARPDVPNKPNPASALAVAEALGLTSRECAFVGDTEIDVETAQRAGMLPIGVAWGFRAGALDGAAHVIGSPFDLLSLL